MVDIDFVKYLERVLKNAQKEIDKGKNLV